MPRTKQVEDDGTPKKRKSNGRDVNAPNIPNALSVPTCKVCRSEHVGYVNILLARGYSLRAIEKQLKDLGEDISYSSIYRHRENHLDLERGAYRQIAEQHVKELQEASAEGQLRIITGKAWLDLFIQKMWDKLLEDDLEFSAGDAIKAIGLRDQMEKEGQDEFRQTIIRQLQAIIVAINEIVPEELRPQIAARAKEIVNDPDMFRQLEPAPIEGEVRELPQGEEYAD